MNFGFFQGEFSENKENGVHVSFLKKKNKLEKTKSKKRTKGIIESDRESDNVEEVLFFHVYICILMVVRKNA